MSSSGTTSSKLIFAPGERSQSDAQQAQQAAQFKVGKLFRSDLSPNPFSQFHSWFSDPLLSGQVPETVTLSTAQLPSGRVSSRMVYLKELDERGFVVYSNWATSRKAADLASNPYVSLCFWWKPVERQVRVEGRGERLPPEESQVYFDTRARGSRLAAWASRQSAVLNPKADDVLTSRTGDESWGESEQVLTDDGRAELEAQVAEVEKKFENVEGIPVPDFWGGLRIVPEMIEFWQGRESRLHDRFRYTKDGNGWKMERLSP